MIIYEMMGCSRSGHHSMMNWIIKNMVGFQCNWQYKLNWMSDTDVYFLGEANHDIPLSFEMIDNFKEKIGTLLTGYEDTPWDYTIFREDRIFKGPKSLETSDRYNFDYRHRIVFIRDFYNNLASRIKSNQKQIFTKWDTGNPHLFEVTDKYIFRWKSQARACVQNKVHYLRFEDWLENKDVRERFLFETFGLKDIFGVDEVDGTVSSFGDNKNVRERFNPDLIPDEIKELIRKDNELHFLIGKLGYEYKEI